MSEQKHSHAIGASVFNAQLEISEQEYCKARDIMYRITGVYLKPSKKPLIVTRLRSRLAELGFKSFRQYLELLEKTGNQEAEVFVNAITTNETFFFRHEEQFNHLYEEILPALVKTKGPRGEKEIAVWSAACSTGEEPYSLAISLMEYSKNIPGWKLRVYASDINTEVLEEAAAARYDEKSLRLVPDTLRKKYFEKLKPVDEYHSPEYLLSPKVKQHVAFRQHNLLAPAPYRGLDIIFLRNVMIYFDRDSKQRAVNYLQESLSPGGHLFISFSETLNDIVSNFTFISHGIYRKER